MPKLRRKISAVKKDFQTELNRLERFDANNQERFISTSITKRQLHFLTESIFFRTFRAYESFIRDIFLLYCLEKKPRSGIKVVSYLNPQNFSHAKELIKSSMRFLDWNNPDIVIERSEVYLKDGFPIKIPYTTNREILLDLHRIRNHIAHTSQESLNSYKIVLRKYYGAVPLVIPDPGEFLLNSDKIHPSKYILQVYFDTLKLISNDLS